MYFVARAATTAGAVAASEEYFALCIMPAADFSPVSVALDSCYPSSSSWAFREQRRRQRRRYIALYTLGLAADFVRGLHMFFVARAAAMAAATEACVAL